MNSTDQTAETPLLLDVAAVARLLGVSVRHVWRMADAGQFPRPVAVGAKLKRWSRAVVLAWIESQTAATSRRQVRRGAPATARPANSDTPSIEVPSSCPTSR